jgi:hypothetical protein
VRRDLLTDAHTGGLRAAPAECEQRVTSFLDGALRSLVT